MNLEIIDTTKSNGETAEQYHRGSGLHKGDGDTVQHTYKDSNPYNVERHISIPEEAEVPEGRYDPQSYVAAIHGYLIYWLWSKHVGWNNYVSWNLKSNLKCMCNLILGIQSRGSVRYIPSSSLYPRYSTYSCTVLCMVLMRVSGYCTVLMVLLTRTHDNM